MRALYSLVSRARTVCALGQTTMTFVRTGPSALTPVQLFLLGCGLCLILRMLVPSPPLSGSNRAIFLDRLCSLIAAAAVIALTATDTTGSCVLVGRLALGLMSFDGHIR